MHGVERHLFKFAGWVRFPFRSDRRTRKSEFASLLNFVSKKEKSFAHRTASDTGPYPGFKVYGVGQSHLHRGVW